MARVEQKLETDAAISFFLNNAGIATVEPQLKTSVKTIEKLISPECDGSDAAGAGGGPRFCRQKIGHHR